MSSSRNVIAPANQPLNIPFQVGNTLQRPSSPPNGFLRVNSQTNYIEVYYNNNWTSIIYIGSLATAAILDPYFMYNILLLTGAGITNSQNNTFIDSSPNNFTITRNGNSTQGTFTPYGTKFSTYFPSETGIYFAPQSYFEFANSNNTIECWYYPTVSSVAYNILIANPYGVVNSLKWGLGIAADGRIIFYDGTGHQIFSSNTVNWGTWNHIALVTDISAGNTNGVVKFFVNGKFSAITGVNLAAFQNSGENIWFNDRGNDPYSTTYSNYISNFRWVRDMVYTGNTITIPTDPLTAITNTKLLTHNTNRFVDTSGNNLPLTLGYGSTVAIQKFSPFCSTTPTGNYTANTYSGSAYFDGSGDYLSFQTNQTPLALSNSDFTLEAWVYRTSSSSGIIFVGQGDNGTAAGSAYIFYVSSSATSDLYIGSGGPGITSPNPTVGTWAHVAWCRTGGTYSSYLNGARVGTNATLGSTSVNVGSTANAPCIGSATNGTASMQGYISNLRLIKGSGGYDATQTTIQIPTVPLTATTNTQLLCNFTNAGIIDNAMMLNLETQTNAKISTTQARFGQSSMFFDGSSTLSIPYTPLLNFGASNFTIEFWTYVTVAPTAEQYFVSVGPAGGGGVNRGWRLAAHNGSAAGIYFCPLGVSGETLLGSFPSINAWHHIAIVRNGGTITGYVDGIALGTTINASTTAITDIISGDYSFVGALQGTAPTGRFFYNGYIQDLRITKGYARYTAAFTPPTQALPTY